MGHMLEHEGVGRLQRGPLNRVLGKPAANVHCLQEASDVITHACTPIVNVK